MSLEISIKDVISQKLVDGTVEKLVEEHLEKGVTKALESLFSSYGDVTKVIEKQVKSVMVPYLENHDYSQYITKLDSVLIDVLKVSALDNKKILENFKELIVPYDEKTIKVTDLFNHWMDYVSNNVDTNDLEIEYDDEVSYESVNVSFEVEHNEDRAWSDMKYATVIFECDHDEKMNFAIRIHQWPKYDKECWTIDYDTAHELSSLRHLNEFEVFLMKLKQNYTKIILDSEYDSNSVEPDARPEPSFS